MEQLRIYVKLKYRKPPEFVNVPTYSTEMALTHRKDAETAYKCLMEDIENNVVDMGTTIYYQDQTFRIIKDIESNIREWYQFYDEILCGETLDRPA